MVMNINKGMKRFWNEEDGIGTLEMILIIAVIVAIAILFKNEIIAIVRKLLDNTKEKTNDFMN
ncbi:Flp1 family type IVb pilin [Paenibacillus sediminis]|uniref:Flp pilus assembly pilin Flp n=1 Tax=Paenibacillus sediminis TaxID=664909 RepID=A0ABS4H4H6_9BACL|nr:Flp1 family type IVb pilin [Paenibacillus sediminis]MBP1937434.1 Flp pilus assembly pilin Flp [Paenibacillus sediminis]